MNEGRKFNKINSINSLHELKDNENKIKIQGLKDFENIMLKLKDMYNFLQKKIINNNEELDNLKISEFKLRILLNELTEEEKKDLMRKTNNEEEETKKLFAEKVEILSKTKKEEIMKKTNEIEYTTSLIHLIETEKINMFNIHKQKVEIIDKLSKIELSYKNIDKSSLIRNTKSRNIELMTSNLKNEITMMNNLIYLQNNKHGELDQNIQRYQTEITKSKESLKVKNLSLEKYVRQQKEVIKKNITSVRVMKNSKAVQEKEIVKLILGLDIIKK